MKSLANHSWKSLLLLLGLVAVIASVGCAGGGENAGDGQNDGQNVEEGVDDENDDGEIADGPVCGDGILDVSEQCDDGDDVGGDGCSEICELELFEAVGDVEIELIADSLIDNSAPVSALCVGEIDVELDGSLLLGDGDCLTDANFASYVLDAEVGPDGAIEGEIAVTFNGQEEVFDVEGLLEDGLIDLAFDGVTLPTNSVRLLWDGIIEIDLD